MLDDAEQAQRQAQYKSSIVEDCFFKNVQAMVKAGVDDDRLERAEDELKLIQAINDQITLTGVQRLLMGCRDRFIFALQITLLTAYIVPVLYTDNIGPAIFALVFLLMASNLQDAKSTAKRTLLHRESAGFAFLQGSQKGRADTGELFREMRQDYRTLLKELQTAKDRQNTPEV